MGNLLKKRKLGEAVLLLSALFSISVSASAILDPALKHVLRESVSEDPAQPWKVVDDRDKTPPPAPVYLPQRNVPLSSSQDPGFGGTTMPPFNYSME